MEFVLWYCLTNQANVDLTLAPPNSTPIVVLSKTEGETPETPNPGDGRR